VAYFAISVDSPETNKAFAQALGVDFPLLSDPSRRVAMAYGVVDKDQPFASRWTFYIGIDGRILHIDKQVSPARQGKMIAAKLAELGVPRRSRGAPEDQRATYDGIGRSSMPWWTPLEPIRGVRSLPRPMDVGRLQTR
jgi:AhpC/TSA family